MSECLGYAKKNQFKEINLETHYKNKPAIRLFEKFGFKTIGDGNNGFITMKALIID